MKLMLNKIKTLEEAIKIYKIQQIIDLDTELGKSMLVWFKASSYTIKYYNRCAFVNV